MSNWESDDQALKAGYLVGILTASGIDAYALVDDEGNYLNEIVVKLDIDDPTLMIKIKVL